MRSLRSKLALKFVAQLRLLISAVRKINEDVRSPQLPTHAELDALQDELARHERDPESAQRLYDEFEWKPANISILLAAIDERDALRLLPALEEFIADVHRALSHMRQKRGMSC